jgi:hypothetical protein
MSTNYIEQSIIAAADAAAIEADRDWEQFLEELEEEREAYHAAERHAELGMMHGISFAQEDPDWLDRFVNPVPHLTEPQPSARLDYDDLPEDPDLLHRFTAQ